MKNKTLKDFFTVGFWTLISRLFGFIRDVFLAAAIGAGPISDVFFVAFKIPNMFRRLTAEGALVQSFLPAYTLLEEKKSVKEAGILAEKVQTTLILSLLLILLLTEIFMSYFIFILAPGFKDNFLKYNMAVEYARYTMPYLPMVSIVALWGSIAQASGRFVPLASAPILLNISLISGSVLILSGICQPMILAIMVPIAGLFQIIFVGTWLFKIGRLPSFKLRRSSKASKNVWKKFIPAALGAGLLQINLLVDTILATLLGDGAVSYLYYADRVAQLPLGIIGIALGTALLPALSKLEAKKDIASIKTEIANSLKYGTIFSIPACLAFIVLSPLITEVLFYRGAFSENDTNGVAIALSAYGFGVPAFIGIKILQPAFFSMGDTMTPFRISIVSVFLNIFISFVLMQFFGHMGIALATSIVAYFVLITSFILLCKRERISFFMIKPLLYISIIGFPFGVLLIYCNNLTQFMNSKISLMIIMITSVIIWFVLMLLFRLIKYKI